MDGMNWQPIETAPDDGTWVWVSGLNDGRGTDIPNRRHQFKAAFLPGNDWSAPAWRDEAGRRLDYLTHWQPLPDPPLLDAARTKDADWVPPGHVRVKDGGSAG